MFSLPSPSPSPLSLLKLPISVPQRERNDVIIPFIQTILLTGAKCLKPIRLILELE